MRRPCTSIIGGLLLVAGPRLSLAAEARQGLSSETPLTVPAVTAATNQLAGLGPRTSLTLDLPAASEQWGTPGTPSNAVAVAGSYYRGDGLGYNVSLTLEANGNYSAEWHGCLGKYGEASGKWSLADARITFTPSKEEDMMKGHLKSLDVLKFQGDWILVPTEKHEREFYDKMGVSRFSCFQKKFRSGSMCEP